MVKRKSFPDVDKVLSKIEHSRDAANRIVIPLEIIPPPRTDVAFPEEGNATDVRGFNFGPWYGEGIDEVVYLCQRQVERFLETHDGDRSIATVVGYCRSGLNAFFDYLVMLSRAYERSININDIDRSIIDGFIDFLDDGEAATSSQRKRYDSVKAVLLALGKRGVLSIQPSGDNATFPRNPYGNRSRSGKGERPLPLAQRKAFTAAIKTAVMPLFEEDAELTGELLAFALLVIALHTGRNTTPLLTLDTNCLRAHPKKGHRFLVLYKRRGHRTQKVPVRKPKTEEASPSVYPTVARLIERIIVLTAPLRAAARTHLSHRLWIYRSQSTNVGQVTALNSSSLASAAKKIVERYKLVDNDGRPMRINVSRLRKTFVNRINDILDGNIQGTAEAAGNTPRVTGTHYLRPSEDAARNWRFMGLALTSELLSATLGATEKTPAGRCTDNKRGQFAPKKEDAVCMNFLDCLRCRNYVVTADDLYRLFSFYFRLYAERRRMSIRKWEKSYRHIIRIIDRDVIAAGLQRKVFKRNEVDEARTRAEVDPHPFWKNTDIFGGEP